MTLTFLGCHLHANYPSCTYLPNPFPLRNPFSSLPKWLSLPLSTQFADIYNIPLFIIKEDHLGERNSSLLLQPVQDTARVTTLAS